MDNRDSGYIQRIMDGALARYSEAAPRAGLEQRVLARVRMDEASRRRSNAFKQWAVGLGVAAVLVAAIGLRRVEAPKPPGNEVSPVAIVRPRSAPADPVRTISKRRAQAKAPAKQRQFPLPAPLSQEERALIALVELHPVESAQAFAQLQQRNNESIQIPEIQAELLPDDGRP